MNCEFSAVLGEHLRLNTNSVAHSFRRVLEEHRFSPVWLVDMLITEDCNCRCDYCFIQGKRPKRMTEEIVKATVDFLLLKSRHLRKVEILFFCGELSGNWLCLSPRYLG